MGAGVEGHLVPDDRDPHLPRPALMALLVASLFYFFSYPGVDNDIWGHLFFGREILRESRLPPLNTYSYTAPDHPWINHEWLAEAIYYAVFRALGSPGLVLLKVAVGGAVVWILNRIAGRRVRSAVTRAAALIWTMAILSPGFNVRPQLGSFLLFAVLLRLFDLHESRGGTVLYAVPGVMALWVNLHGGFVVGLGAMALFCAWRAFGSRRSPAGPSAGGVADLLLPCGLSVLALGINPFGFRLLEFVVRDLRIDRPISEWQPVHLLDASFPAFKLALLALLPTFATAGAWRRWQVPLAALAALFALQHQRHTPLFGLVAAPLLAEAVDAGRARLGALVSSPAARRAARRLALMAALACAGLEAAWIGRIHAKHGFRIVVSPYEFPIMAADFFRRNGLRGNLAVPFDWGEYLIWKLYPQARVSIDGRYTTAYPQAVIEGLWGWMQGRKEWRNLSERYPTEIALTRLEQPITAILLADPRWVCVYQDPTAAIFVRDVPAQRDVLRRFREGLLIPPRDPGTDFPG